MMMTASLAALWLLVLSRLSPCVRNRGDLMFFVALSSALACTIALPGVAPAVDQALDGPGNATVLAGGLSMLALGLFRSAIVKAVVSPELQEAVLRRGHLQTTAAITVYGVAFACAALVGAVSDAPGPGHAAVDPASQSDVGIFVFMATLCTYMIAVSIEIAAVCVRYLPLMASRLFRVGFGCVATGCGLLVVGMSVKLLRQIVVLTFVGLDYEPALETAFSVVLGFGGLFLSFGLMLPAMSGRVAAWQVHERYRLLRLHPVWARTAHSSVVIDSVSVPLKGVISRNPRARLHRALVEILDSDLAAGGTLLSTSESKLVKKSEGTLYA